MLTAICRGKDDNDYWFYDDRVDDMFDYVVYVVDDNICTAHDPMNGKNDALTDSEMYLDDNELFVVAYNDCYDGGAYYGEVDMGITKHEIIQNVLANKYSNGARFWTFGQMLKTTHDWLNE